MEASRQQTLGDYTEGGALDVDNKDDIPAKLAMYDNFGDSQRATALKLSLYDGKTQWQCFRMHYKAVIWCVLCALPALLDGYQIGINGNIIANAGFIKQFGNQITDGKLSLSAHVVSSWGAVQSCGQLIGMLGLAPIAEVFGRKAHMAGICLILACSILAESLARSWQVWLVGKLFAGIGVGAIQGGLPPYISELAPTPIRGLCLTFYSIAFNIGAWMGPLVLQRLNATMPMDYLTAIYTQWAMIGLFAISLLVCPESPWFYARKGQPDKSLRVLNRLNGSAPGYVAEDHLQVINNTLAEEEENKSKQPSLSKMWIECFQGNDRRRTIGAIIPQTTCQMAGLVLFFSYATYFFQSAGLSDPFLSAVIVNAVNLASPILMLFFSDTIGRRRLFLVAGVVCAISMAIIGILGCVELTGSLQKFLVFVACVFTFHDQILGTIGWTMMGELPSQRLRTATAGIAASTSVVFGICWNTSIPYMLNAANANWGLKTAFLFSGLGAICTAIGYIYVPETKKRSEAELDELYAHGVPVRHFRKTVTDVETKCKT